MAIWAEDSAGSAVPRRRPGRPPRIRIHPDGDVMTRRGLVLATMTRLKLVCTHPAQLRQLALPAPHLGGPVLAEQLRSAYRHFAAPDAAIP